MLLPVVKGWFGNKGGQVIALIKPQFEAGRKVVSKGKGVVRDPEVHKQVLEDVLGFAQKEGYGVSGLVRSPLMGPKGNTEFLAQLTHLRENADEIEILIGEVFSNQAQG